MLIINCNHPTLINRSLFHYLKNLNFLKGHTALFYELILIAYIKEMSNYNFDSDLLLYIPDIFKTNVSNQFLSIKSPFEFVFLYCEFTKLFCSQKAGVKCSC